MKIKIIALAFTSLALLAINTELKANSSETTIINKFVGEEKQASFPGGKEELSKWLKENMDYPADMQRFGTVTVDFKVSKNGKLSDFAIRKGVNEELDVMAIEILRGMPKWEPAMKDGKAVESKVQLPVKFIPKNQQGGLDE